MNSDLLRWSAAVLMAGLLVGSCERSVPTDSDPGLRVADVPVPSALAARPGDGIVELSWTLSSVDSSSVERFIIYRRDSTRGEFERRDSVDWSPFEDATVRNGIAYAYRVAARSTSGIEGEPSSAVPAEALFMSLLINNDSDYTASTVVRVRLTADGASLVRLANDTTQPGPWRAYQNSVDWTLERGPGPRTVFGQFRLADATETIGWVYDDIEIDERAEIRSVSVSDSVLAPGDSMTVIVDCGEPDGSASFALSSQPAVPLFDDGLPPDAIAGDGRYSGIYRATATDLFEQRELKADFRDRAGNRAASLSAPWKLSVRQPPDPPVWLALLPLAQEPTKLALSWTAVDAEPFGQLILRRAQVPGAGLGGDIIKTFTSAGTTNYTDTGLVGSTTYYYTLELVLENGLSTVSAEGSATTATDVPPKPVTLIVEPTTDSSLSLSWTAAEETDFASYRVFRAASESALSDTANDSLVVKILSSKTETTYKENGLTTLYWYRVFVYDRAGQRTGSNRVWGPKVFGP